MPGSPPPTGRGRSWGVPKVSSLDPAAAIPSSRRAGEQNHSLPVQLETETGSRRTGDAKQRGAGLAAPPEDRGCRRIVDEG